MDKAHLNRMSAWVPLMCSLLAFGIAMANILAGVPPQPDENASAHLWQLLIVLQLPLVVLFATTSDWSHWSRPARLLGLQASGIVLACVPVYLAGY
jgi:hypothetical protein